MDEKNEAGQPLPTSILLLNMNREYAWELAELLGIQPRARIVSPNEICDRRHSLTPRRRLKFLTATKVAQWGSLRFSGL